MGTITNATGRRRVSSSPYVGFGRWEELEPDRSGIADFEADDWRWKRRFEQQGLAGLDPRHKGSAPRTATASVQARVLRKTTQRPPDGSTHWTCRKMAEALGLSKSTVQRIWRQARLQPHRLERYMASNDPNFEKKAADIIALYMKPPQHAAVFCVDGRAPFRPSIG